jgi:outer membrane lipoprotein-sorting protein
MRLDRAAESRCLLIACWLFVVIAPAQAQTAESALQKTRDTYANLNSYADTGTIIVEYGSSSVDKHSFSTSFNRSPRGFLLDFHKQGGDRYVIWADPGAFHTWWKTTGQQYDYPNPNNTPAISLSGPNTKDAAMKIPTLLYGKSQLAAAMLNLADPVLEGTDQIGGHRCHRISGRASDTYAASGKAVNIHKTTVWIDDDSFLVRKVLEDWKALPGQRARLITTFEPRANPNLEKSPFQFVPPQPK